MNHERNNQGTTYRKETDIKQ